jgi:hypothetical protein
MLLGMAIGVGVGGFVVLLIVVAAFLLHRRRQRHRCQAEPIPVPIEGGQAAVESSSQCTGASGDPGSSGLEEKAVMVQTLAAATEASAADADEQPGARVESMVELVEVRAEREPGENLDDPQPGVPEAHEEPARAAQIPVNVEGEESKAAHANAEQSVPEKLNEEEKEEKEQENSKHEDREEDDGKEEKENEKEKEEKKAEETGERASEGNEERKNAEEKEPKEEYEEKEEKEEKAQGENSERKATHQQKPEDGNA